MTQAADSGVSVDAHIRQAPSTDPAASVSYRRRFSSVILDLFNPRPGQLPILQSVYFHPHRELFLEDQISSPALNPQ
jgi:hypothetical protein